MSGSYPDQLVELVSDCRERMVRVETLLTVRDERESTMLSTQADHDRRLTRLEANNRIMAAFGAAVLVVLPLLQPFIMAWFKIE